MFIIIRILFLILEKPHPHPLVTLVGLFSKFHFKECEKQLLLSVLSTPKFVQFDFASTLCVSLSWTCDSWTVEAQGFYI